MGIGRIRQPATSPALVDIIVSFQQPADEMAWRNAMTEASRKLHAATNGQLMLGRVFHAPNSAAKMEADLKVAAASTSFSRPAVLPYVLWMGTPEIHALVREPMAFSIVHEFSHYAFDLGEEYTATRDCLNASGVQACIMEYGGGTIFDDVITMWCGQVAPRVHTGGNVQDTLHNESCVETVEHMSGLLGAPIVIPDPVADPPPATFVDPDWIGLVDNRRFGLLLDKSGSMAGAPLAGVKDAASFWLTHTADVNGTSILPSEEFAICAYDHNIQPITHLSVFNSTADPAVTNALQDISTLGHGGNTNIGGALVEGMNELAPVFPMGMASTQILVLFSDGIQTQGTDPGTVLNDLVDRNIRVFALGFGPNVHIPTMRDIAEQTRGEYHPIAAASDILGAMAHVRAATSSGLIALDTDVIRGGKGKTFEARVEEGAESVTFLVTYGDGAGVHLSLYRPGEEDPVDPASSRAASYYESDSTYAHFVVGSPEAGVWQVRVDPRNADEVPFMFMAFASNRKIAVGLVGIQQTYAARDEFPLLARITSNGVPLTGLATATIRTADGERTWELAEEETASGTYFTWLSFAEAGSYELVAEIESGPETTGVLKLPDPEVDPEVYEFTPEAVPAFSRLRRFFIHVEPEGARGD